MRIVKDGNVHVSAPFGMPKAEVVRFVKEHRDWIVKARKKIDERQKRRAAFYDQLPLQTKAQADEVMSRLKALVEPSDSLQADDFSMGRVQRQEQIHLFFCLSAVAARVVCRTRRSSRTVSSA